MTLEANSADKAVVDEAPSADKTVVDKVPWRPWMRRAACKDWAEASCLISNLLAELGSPAGCAGRTAWC